jgi:hypothetical protein
MIFEQINGRKNYIFTVFNQYFKVFIDQEQAHKL